MSTSTLRELVEAIKTQGKTLANATGASAATARDLVYLSTSVERLFGADAILELVDSAAKPVEVVSAALASTQAVDLTVDQVTKTVIKFTNTSGTHTATEFTATIPNQGVAFVVDNEMPVPVKFKTSTQTTNIVQVGANKKGWVFCDGTVVEHVVDIEGITSALTSPTQNPGDMIYREGKASGSTQYYNVTVENYGGQNQYFFTPYDGYDNQDPWNYERTPNIIMYPGVTYRFYQDHSSNTGHPLKFSATADGTHATPAGTELLDINSDGTNDITYSGTPGTATAYTQVVVPTTGTNIATIYYYCGSHSGMGGDNVVTIPATTGVTKLPIGKPYQQLAVDSDGNRPEWVNRNVFGGANIAAAAPCYDVTGTWSEGRFRMATEITNATDYQYQANKGTYNTDVGEGNTCSGYRGSQAIYWANGRPAATSWGNNNEGRNGAHYNKYDAYSGTNWSMNYPLGKGIDGMDDVQNEYANYDVKQVFGTYAIGGLLLSNGTVWMTGRNDEGELGIGSTTDTSAYTKVNMPSTAGEIRYVATTGQDSPTNAQTFYALTVSGKVYAWGYNAYGQCGSSSGTNLLTPVEIPGLSNVDAISAGGGDYGWCSAIDTSGNAYTWGYNGYGQLGHGSTTATATPTQVQPNGSDKVAKIVIDGNGSYGTTHFVMASGRVYGCGYNNYGSIGDGSTTQRNSPVLVSNLGLSANTYVVDMFSCGGAYLDNSRYYLTDNGDVYGHGQNVRGQLGQGNGTQYNSPVLIPGIKYISQATTSGTTTSTSYYYNCVQIVSHRNWEDRRKRINGTLKSAGYTSTSIGRLNVGTNSTTFEPCNFDNRASGRIRYCWFGGYHNSSTQEMSAYAIDMDGRMWAWGYNNDGSTWNNNSNSSYIPIIAN